MFYVSEIKTSAPAEFKTATQKSIYTALQTLSIPFERVETDEAVTIDDCTAIELKLRAEMVKTLFLTNRQKTEFFLFVTKGHKPFSSKDFSKSLNVARLSFAPAELMHSMLGTDIGAATALSIVNASADKVRIVFDSEVAALPEYACSDGTTTSFIKIATRHVLQLFVQFTRHKPEIITV